MHRLKKIVMSLCLVLVVNCFGMQGLFAMQQEQSAVTLEQEFCDRLRGIDSQDVVGIVRDYLARGLDVRKTFGPFGNNVLHAVLHANVSQNSCCSILKLFTEHNAGWVEEALNSYNARGLTPLHDAILSANEVVTREFLRSGAGVSRVTGKGAQFEGRSCLSLALRIASPDDRIKMFNLLLTGNESWATGLMSDYNDQGLMHLHEAILQGEVEIVKQLLKHGADIAVIPAKGSDFEGKSCLHLAGVLVDDRKRNALLDLLIEHEHGKDLIKANVNEYGVGGMTPFMDAVLHGDVEIVKKFLLFKSDITKKTGKGNEFEGRDCFDLAFHIADDEKRRAVFDALVEYDQDWAKVRLDTYNPQGLKPIHSAILKGDVQTTKRLLRFGANIEVVTGETDRYQGDNCLSLALRIQDDARCQEMLEVLFGHDEAWAKSIMNRPFSEGLTPFHVAILNGRVGAVRFFLQHNADIKILTDVGNVHRGTHCLSLALRIQDDGCRQQMVRLLFERDEAWAREEQNKLGSNGVTPLQDAILVGDVILVGMLFEWGADVTVLTDERCPTPDSNCLVLALHIRDSVKRQQMINILWRHGGDRLITLLNKRGYGGLTPIQHAILKGDLMSVTWLLDKGADVTILTDERDRYPGSNCLNLALNINSVTTGEPMLNLLVKKYHEKNVLYDGLTVVPRKGDGALQLAKKHGRSIELDAAVASVSGCEDAADYIKTYAENKRAADLAEEENKREAESAERLEKLAKQFCHKLFNDFDPIDIPAIKARVQSYLDEGLDIKKARHEKGRNLLHVVCKSKLSEDKICVIIDCFCDHNKDVVLELLAEYDEEGLTPFHTAVLRGLVSVVRHLMSLGDHLYHLQITGPGYKHQGDNVLFLVFLIKDGVFRQEMFEMLVKALDECKVLKKYLTEESHGRTVDELTRACLRRGKMLKAALVLEGLRPKVEAYVAEQNQFQGTHFVHQGPDDDPTAPENIERLLDGATNDRRPQNLYLVHRHAYYDHEPNLPLHRHLMHMIFHDINDIDSDTLSKRVRQLLQEGVDITRREGPGENLLHVLCFPEVDEDKRCVILDCFFNHDQQIVRQALTQRTNNGLTPLHKAIILGQVKIAEKFIEMGADLLILANGDLANGDNVLMLAFKINDGDRRKEMLAMLIHALHAKRSLYWCLQTKANDMNVIQYAHEHWLSKDLDDAFKHVHSNDRSYGVAQDYVRTIEAMAADGTADGHYGWLVNRYCCLCKQAHSTIVATCTKCGCHFTNVTRSS